MAAKSRSPSSKKTSMLYKLSPLSNYLLEARNGENCSSLDCSPVEVFIRKGWLLVLFLALAWFETLGLLRMGLGHNCAGSKSPTYTSAPLLKGWCSLGGCGCFMPPNGLSRILLRLKFDSKAFEDQIRFDLLGWSAEVIGWLNYVTISLCFS